MQLNLIFGCPTAQFALLMLNVLYTRSGQSYFLLANQKAHLPTHEPIKRRVTKVNIKLKFVASASAVFFKAISALNPPKCCRKIPKVRQKLNEMFKIYDSAR